MTNSATSHLLPVFARVDLGFELGAAMADLQGDLQILAYRQALEYARHLELDREAAVDAGKGCEARD
ncbi:hypothetical protein KXW38_001427, partial [Aspergillus fumigatus]